MEKKHFKMYALLLVIIFALQFLYISPQGEFSLNDDWVHTDSAHHFAKTGTLRMLPFAGPTFYVPIAYGAGLIHTFGFSHTLLRISTLALAMLTLLLVYVLLTKMTRPLWAFFGSLLLFVNPIFYNLSFTFMTDIPALFFLTAGLLCYWIGFKEKRPAYLFLGSLLSVAGAFTRQTNILLLAAAGLYALSQPKKIPFRHIFWSFGAPLTLGAGIYLYLLVHNLLPQGASLHYISDASLLFEHALWWSWYTLVYLGFFALPLCGGWLWKRKRIWKNKKLFLYLLIPLLVALILRQVKSVQFPYILNIINIYGLGPMQGVLNGKLISLFSSKVWGVLTLLFAASGGWCVYILREKSARLKRPVGLIWLFGILYVLPILLFESFDRYYLPLFLTLIVLIIIRIHETQFSFPMMFLLMCVYAMFSISQTDFYLQWNQERWDLANTILETSGRETHEIDGGYEWNGMHSYWSAQESDLPHGAWTAPWWIRNLFVNNTEEYIVSFSPIPPYDVVESKKIHGWNPNNQIFLLKKPTREEPELQER